MSKQNIRWAKTHDWFLDAIGGAVFVRDWTECGSPTIASFRDIEELRSWAGY